MKATRTSRKFSITNQTIQQRHPMLKECTFRNGEEAPLFDMLQVMAHMTIWTSDITTRVKVVHMQHWKILRWAFLRLGEL